ncbi:hypothetical protein ACIOJ9_28840 [Streptomyces sp. NPDC088175]|uniref:hypothetical protein n=1 Tax=unclassified Streptomyces TaxID=2593676 RepID=UPI003814C61E
MALYMLKEVNPATGQIFRDDDTTSYYADEDYDGDAYAAAMNGYDLRVAQTDLDWGPGSGAQRWTLLKVG